MAGIVLSRLSFDIQLPRCTNARSSPVAYPGWHTPGVQTEDGVLAPPGQIEEWRPSAEVLVGEGGSMLEVIISFSDNVLGIRLLKIALTLN